MFGYQCSPDFSGLRFALQLCCLVASDENRIVIMKASMNCAYFWFGVSVGIKRVGNKMWGREQENHYQVRSAKSVNFMLTIVSAVAPVCIIDMRLPNSFSNSQNSVILNNCKDNISSCCATGC